MHKNCLSVGVYFAASMGRNKQPRKGILEVSVTRTRLTASFVGTTRTSSFRDRFAISTS
jgi:hypothetical protein